MGKAFDESFINAINATKRRSGRRLSREAVASVGKRGIFGAKKSGVVTKANQQAFDESYRKAMSAARKSHVKSRETKGTVMIRTGKPGPRGDYKPSQQWFLTPSRTDMGFAVKVNRGGRLFAVAIQGMGRNIDYTTKEGARIPVSQTHLMPPQVYNRVREMFDEQNGWRDPATAFPRGVERVHGMTKKTETWQVYSLDAWNSPDGWYENNRFRAGTLELPERATNRQILKAMRDQGYLQEGSSGKVGIEDFGTDPPSMWITDRSSGEPLFAVELPYED